MLKRMDVEEPCGFEGDDDQSNFTLVVETTSPLDAFQEWEVHFLDDQSFSQSGASQIFHLVKPSYS